MPYHKVIDELEEERRLAYVGITRAEETLYLMNANQRVLYGKTNYNRPSRFISEIDDELLKQIADQAKEASKNKEEKTRRAHKKWTH